MGDQPLASRRQQLAQAAFKGAVEPCRCVERNYSTGGNGRRVIAIETSRERSGFFPLLLED